MSLHSGTKILDVGCGEGRHTCESIRFKNLTVFGTDIVFDNILSTREKLKFHGKLGEIKGRWELSVADIAHLPFRTDCFDGIICAEVLEHIRDDSSALSEFKRVLKPGKMLAVSVPRYLPEKICWKLSREYRNTENGHVRIYRRKELSDLIENVGFKRVGLHYAHSLHSPYWWLKCLVGPSRDDAAPVKLYHRFLTWDIMKQPALTRMLDRLMNPILGKSLVFYFTNGTSGSPIMVQ